MGKLIKTTLAGTLLSLLGLSCAIGLIRHDIKRDVNEWCETAQAEYSHPNDDVAALLAYVQSESHTLKDRNHVIWALGQSRDARALPVLENYFTNRECNHSQNLCQHELEKAIRLCSKSSPDLSGQIKPHHH
jgi:hypothetical protein